MFILLLSEQDYVNNKRAVLKPISALNALTMNQYYTFK